MKTKSMGIALLTSTALLAGAAARAELPWTYVEGAYTKYSGTEDEDTTSWAGKASVGFATKWHASLAYENGKTEITGSPNRDFDGYQLIIGAHPSLTPNTQLVTDLTYYNYNDDAGDYDGYGVGLGLRHSLSDKFELGAEAFYTQTSVDNVGGGSTDSYDTSVQVQGRYNWTPNFSVGLTVPLTGVTAGGGSFSSSSSAARFDIRWSFLGNISDSTGSMSDSF